MATTEPVLPNLSVQQLSYLVAAAREATFGRAAELLGVSLSTLSQGLSELERRLGVEIFERHGRRQVLRPEAVEVVAYAERVMAQTRDLVRWAEERRTGRGGRLRVGMIDAAAIHHDSAGLRQFRRTRPEVDLLLTVAPSGELLHQLTNGALDLVVCVAPDGPLPGLRTRIVHREPLAVYAPPGIHEPDPARWGPWVTFPAGSHTRRLITDALRALGARFEVVAESHQPDVLREMVRLGVGWTVLPVVQAESRPAPLRRARPDPVAWRELVVARRDGGPPNAAADALESLLMSGAN
jgi:DNA-binding transcriptional LysR family regulator